jgi:hypothetical protein
MQKYDKRTPGLFKVEAEIYIMISLHSKIFCVPWKTHIIAIGVHVKIFHVNV